MLVPNKHGTSRDYRFGFNGKEKDDEIKGEGTQYDYGFRIYDPRIGKFLSQDPLFKSFPWYTPYQFAGNKPIAAIDLDGLEERIVIMHTTVAGKIRREVLDAKTLLRTTYYVGVKHSALYEPITTKEFTQYKKQLWDAFSNSPELFASGYKSYTVGGMNVEKYKNSGFIGLNKGTLTIGSSENGSTISYDPIPIDRTTPSSMKIIREAPNNPEMAKGINTAKNYVAGISLCVSGPSLLLGTAGKVGYVGAIYDVDQLTGASEKLTKGHPKVAQLIGVIEIAVDLVSLKSAPIEIIDMFKGTNKATEVIPSTIVGAADTIGDVESTITTQPNKE